MNPLETPLPIEVGLEDLDRVAPEAICWFMDTFLEPEMPCMLAEDCLAMPKPPTPPEGAGPSISKASRPLVVPSVSVSASTASSNTDGTA